MSNVNTITISGNLTRDPELRHTASGTPVCNLRLASNRSRKNAEGTGYEDETTYVDVTVWSGFGELVAKKLRKADALCVTGRLEMRQWDAEDGTKRTAYAVVANDIDSQALFRSADDVPPASAPAAEFVPAAAASQQDDIPF